MQGAQKLRSEAYLLVRCNDEVEAQRSRWTFYETINFLDYQGGKRYFLYSFKKEIQIPPNPRLLKAGKGDFFSRYSGTGFAVGDAAMTHSKEKGLPFGREERGDGTTGGLIVV